MPPAFGDVTETTPIVLLSSSPVFLLCCISFSSSLSSALVSPFPSGSRLLSCLPLFPPIPCLLPFCLASRPLSSPSVSSLSLPPPSPLLHLSYFLSCFSTSPPALPALDRSAPAGCPQSLVCSPPSVCPVLPAAPACPCLYLFLMSSGSHRSAPWPPLSSTPVTPGPPGPRTTSPWTRRGKLPR